MEAQKNKLQITRTLLLKNMTSNCCIRIVKQLLEEIGVTVNSIKLGVVCITYDIGAISDGQIKNLLKNEGFEIIVDKEKSLVEQIKISVIELIHMSNYSNSIIRNSDYLVDKLHLSYQYLSTIFSKHENITLEKFIINHKIEKAKELISYDELTLSEISYQMGYSSVQYLSTQFKNITGVSVTEFKKNPSRYRKSLDKIAE